MEASHGADSSTDKGEIRFPTRNTRETMETTSTTSTQSVTELPGPSFSFRSVDSPKPCPISVKIVPTAANGSKSTVTVLRPDSMYRKHHRVCAKQGAEESNPNGKRETIKNKKDPFRTFDSSIQFSTEISGRGQPLMFNTASVTAKSLPRTLNLNSGFRLGRQRQFEAVAYRYIRHQYREPWLHIILYTASVACLIGAYFVFASIVDLKINIEGSSFVIDEEIKSLEPRYYGELTPAVTWVNPSSRGEPFSWRDLRVIPDGFNPLTDVLPSSGFGRCSYKELSCQGMIGTINIPYNFESEPDYIIPPFVSKELSLRYPPSGTLNITNPVLFPSFETDDLGEIISSEMADRAMLDTFISQQVNAREQGEDPNEAVLHWGLMVKRVVNPGDEMFIRNEMDICGKFGADIEYELAYDYKLYFPRPSQGILSADATLRKHVMNAQVLLQTAYSRYNLSERYGESVNNSFANVKIEATWSALPHYDNGQEDSMDSVFFLVGLIIASFSFFIIFQAVSIINERSSGTNSILILSGLTSTSELFSRLFWNFAELFIPVVVTIIVSVLGFQYINTSCENAQLPEFNEKERGSACPFCSSLFDTPLPAGVYISVAISGIISVCVLGQFLGVVFKNMDIGGFLSATIIVVQFIIFFGVSTYTYCIATEDAGGAEQTDASSDSSFLASVLKFVSLISGSVGGVKSPDETSPTGSAVIYSSGDYQNAVERGDLSLWWCVSSYTGWMYIIYETVYLRWLTMNYSYATMLLGPDPIYHRIVKNIYIGSSIIVTESLAMLFFSGIFLRWKSSSRSREQMSLTHSRGTRDTRDTTRTTIAYGQRPFAVVPHIAHMVERYLGLADDAYVSKPFSFRILWHGIVMILRNWKAAKMICRQERRRVRKEMNGHGWEMKKKEVVDTDFSKDRKIGKKRDDGFEIIEDKMTFTTKHLSNTIDDNNQLKSERKLLVPSTLVRGISGRRIRKGKSSMSKSIDQSSTTAKNSNQEELLPQSRSRHTTGEGGHTGNTTAGGTSGSYSNRNNGTNSYTLDGDNSDGGVSNSDEGKENMSFRQGGNQLKDEMDISDGDASTFTFGSMLTQPSSTAPNNYSLTSLTDMGPVSSSYFNPNNNYNFLTPSMKYIISRDVKREAENSRLGLPYDSPPYVRAVSLTKTYKIHRSLHQRALNNVSLSCSKNECLGILGPNGAGKSTMMELLCGIKEASHGVAMIMNTDVMDPFTRPVIRRESGVCTQENIYWNNMSVEEHLKTLCLLKGVKQGDVKEHIHDLLEAVGLLGQAKIKAGQLSGGMKRRLSLAYSLVGSPKVLFFDEPTTGLDPATKRGIWNVILSLKRDRAIILTTHSMEEAETLCDRIAILANGELICIGKKDHLKKCLGRGVSLQVTVNVNGNKGKTADVESGVGIRIGVGSGGVEGRSESESGRDGSVNMDVVTGVVATECAKSAFGTMVDDGTVFMDGLDARGGGGDGKCEFGREEEQGDSRIVPCPPMDTSKTMANNVIDTDLYKMNDGEPLVVNNIFVYSHAEKAVHDEVTSVFDSLSAGKSTLVLTSAYCGSLVYKVTDVDGDPKKTSGIRKEGESRSEKPIKIANIFKTMEKICSTNPFVLDWNVVQSSLESIFLSIVGSSTTSQVLLTI